MKFLFIAMWNTITQQQVTPVRHQWFLTPDNSCSNCVSSSNPHFIKQQKQISTHVLSPSLSLSDCSLVEEWFLEQRKSLAGWSICWISAGRARGGTLFSLHLREKTVLQSTWRAAWLETALSFLMGHFNWMKPFMCFWSQFVKLDSCTICHKPYPAMKTLSVRSRHLHVIPAFACLGTAMRD